MIVFGGNGLRSDTRRPGVEWNHSVQNPGNLVRDFVKWDDQPISLQSFAESTVRGGTAYAMTAPTLPVMVCLDMDIQEEANEHPEQLRIPKMTRLIQPQGDTGALRDAAKLLVGAQKPVIVADRAVRSQNGVKLMVELAEALGAPVIDNGGRMNFPSTHELDCTFMRQTLLRDADVVLLLEVSDPWGTLNSFADPYKTYQPIIKPDTKVIAVPMREVYLKSNYQDIQRYQAIDLRSAAMLKQPCPTIESINAPRPQSQERIAERAKTIAKCTAR
jgi:thiamine pyrophosphate-dependent acetolactate synthase large subunit-like protein